jgi:cytochrome c553
LKPAAQGFVSVLVCLAACARAESTEPARSSGGDVRTPAVLDDPAPPPDLAAHMQASFWMAVRARDCLIDGDLPEARRAAELLAEQDYSKVLPAEWQHWVVQLQAHARDLSTASDLDSASQALGRVALTCGDCHDLHQRGAGRTRQEPKPWQDPPDPHGARMWPHQSGAAQIWNGLVLPSEHSFRLGTITLSRAPLSPADAGAPLDPRVAAAIEEVRALTRRARAATTHDERGRVYGELVARCASCHALVL